MITLGIVGAVAAYCCTVAFVAVVSRQDRDLPAVESSRLSGTPRHLAAWAMCLALGSIGLLALAVVEQWQT